MTVTEELIDLEVLLTWQHILVGWVWGEMSWMGILEPRPWFELSLQYKYVYLYGRICFLWINFTP